MDLPTHSQESSYLAVFVMPLTQMETMAFYGFETIAGSAILNDHLSSFCVVTATVCEWRQLDWRIGDENISVDQIADLTRKAQEWRLCKTLAKLVI